jgi:Dockerin type I domain
VWSLWMTQSLNAHNVSPTFTAPILASSHHLHRGGVQTLIGGQCGNASRAFGDYLQLRTGPQGEAQIAYADSNSLNNTTGGHAMYVHQNGGTGLYAASSPVSISGITPFNGVLDPAGDGKYEVAGISNANMPQLDIVSSNVSLTTAAPCSAAAPCYRVFMQLNNLSLAPTTAQDPDVDLVWSTQWIVPSSTDPNGGKNFHVYAESTNGVALQCYTGQTALLSESGGFTLTYPGGLTALPAEQCQSTLGPNGNITIYVPLSSVSVADPIDNRLHEVTASTMTLNQPANSVQPDPVLNDGGVPFNLIDVAQGYVFDPDLVSAVSRKTHGTAGTFDIDLVPGSGIEDRSGGSNGDFQIVVTFAAAVVGFNSAVMYGTGSVSTALASGNQVFINLTGVTNAQRISLTLFGVNEGTKTADYSVQMGVLLGDVNASGHVDAGDIGAIQQVNSQTANSTNFRADVNASGHIDAGDIGLTQSQNSTGLPP